VNVAIRGDGIVFDRRDQVNLGNKSRGRTIENRGIFKGFVLALGHREENEPRIFAEIVDVGASANLSAYLAGWLSRSAKDFLTPAETGDPGAIFRYARS
jgi:hypothetical protein